MLTFARMSNARVVRSVEKEDVLEILVMRQVVTQGKFAYRMSVSIIHVVSLIAKLTSSVE